MKLTGIKPLAQRGLDGLSRLVGQSRLRWLECLNILRGQVGQSGIRGLVGLTAGSPSIYNCPVLYLISRLKAVEVSPCLILVYRPGWWTRCEQMYTI